MNNKILAIIPAYNEEKSIKKVIENIQDTVSGILVIDDGSSDNTTKYAKETGFNVITFKNNQGKGAAIRAGYEYFARSDYDIAIIIDGDGQYTKEAIIPVCDPIIHNKADLVVGSRFLGEYYKKTPEGRKIRTFCNNIATETTRFMSGLPITDAQSGLVALNKKSIEKLNLKAQRWGIHQEILIQAGKHGLRYLEVPSTVKNRLYGVSKIKVIKYPLTALPVMLKAWFR
ncbi:glycosyltransferase family 2 protein [Methanococcus maripaludis]|uniref:Glycosyltransferase involved in cell wall biosynthesis n=1 Tax=Methanococcus maripaludis TaxID=39152 RepID=A0A7J9PCG0_METMI|nr:glycosyltransferase family 2 protein [Methanococcus maripaludis]MBA2860468.1 glycosyltransferase involved in cell wall biosynthesis [Methanococcus maripaludis]